MIIRQTSDYRDRLYDRYLSTSGVEIAPRGVAGFRPRAASLRRLIRRHFPPDRDATVLDLGCGHGALVYFARLAGYRNATGVDTSAEQVAEAKRLGIEGVVQGGVMEALRSLPDASQDVVIAFDVIEHLRKDELLDLADEVLRTLKGGGRWIIHAPNAASPLFGMIRYGDYTHEQAFTPRSITQVLLTTGFRRVECFEDEPIPHGLKSLVRFGLWKLIKSCLSVYLLAEMGDGGGQDLHHRLRDGHVQVAAPERPDGVSWVPLPPRSTDRASHPALGDSRSGIQKRVDWLRSARWPSPGSRRPESSTQVFNFALN